MKRKITMAVLILVSTFLQCSLFQSFEIASIKPNLLMIITVSFGLMCGRKMGLWTGFFCGLCLDLLFPGTIGMETLAYMWIGYVSGFAFRIFYDEDIKTPLLLISGGTLVYGIYKYILTFLMRGRIHFFWYLGRIIIPEILYTLIITLLVYRLLYKLNQWLSKSDKRSLDSFV